MSMVSMSAPHVTPNVVPAPSPPYPPPSQPPQPVPPPSPPQSGVPVMYYAPYKRSQTQRQINSILKSHE